VDAHQKVQILVEEAEALGRRDAGATETDIKSLLFNYAWNLKKRGLADETIRTYVKALKHLIAKGADLNNPDSVNEALAKAKWSSGWKNNVAAAYKHFARINGLMWEPPKLTVTRKIPFIPTEKELDILISACGPKTSAFLQLLKETGMRCGEAIRLKWCDVDLERHIITLNAPEKAGKPRIWKISRKLATMLSRLPKEGDRVFGRATTRTLRRCLWNVRKRLAYKLQNPRLNRISFHTFRHWKATMLYHETKDPVYVKEFLGHQKLDTTLLYIQIERALFKEDDEFIVKVARTKDEIVSLLEAGFEYVCEKDGLAYFRKRK